MILECRQPKTMCLEVTFHSLGYIQDRRDLQEGINEYKKGCQPKINLVSDKNGHLLADSQTF
jgi:hypothetical protein